MTDPLVQPLLVVEDGRLSPERIAKRMQAAFTASLDRADPGRDPEPWEDLPPVERAAWMAAVESVFADVRTPLSGPGVVDVMGRVTYRGELADVAIGGQAFVRVTSPDGVIHTIGVRSIFALHQGEPQRVEVTLGDGFFDERDDEPWEDEEG